MGSVRTNTKDSREIIGEAETQIALVFCRAAARVAGVGVEGILDEALDRESRDVRSPAHS